jgi:hypothetical protein
MLDIIITIVLTGAFFILFFEPKFVTKNKRKEEIEESHTAHGFIEDTKDAFIMPRYPSQLMERNSMGDTIPIKGEPGNFTGYSSISEYHWLHGFPHKKAQ